MKNAMLIRSLAALALIFLALIPGRSYASALDADQDFADSQVVSDNELSTQRGGYIDINGVLLDFNYLARLDVNGTNISAVNVDTTDLINAAAANNQNFLQPTVVQNVDNNALIAMQQQLNLTISGANIAATNQTMAQIAAFQNVLGAH